MKHFLFIVAIAALLVSCEKENVIHTGDVTGTLYGIWALDSKTVALNDKTSTEDYSKAHFFLSLSEPFLALAKKGSFTEADLKDVDVDGAVFNFNADLKKIEFKDMLWLSDEFLSYNMILKGTFDVLELTDKSLVISQNDLLGTTTTYTYHRYR